MLIGGIILGLVLGLLLGGRLERLAEIRLRYLPVLFLAVILRFGTEFLLGTGGDVAAVVDALRLPLFALAYAMLLFVLWANRGYPGLALAFVGVLFNAIVIVVNGGRMPVWMPAYEVSGLAGPLSSVLHYPMQGDTIDFLLHLGPLGDIIPLPVPPVQNVASVGDLFLTAGLAFFLFATLLRAPDEIEAAIVEARLGRYAGVQLAPPPVRLDQNGLAIPQGTGLSPALEAAAVLERPQMLGAGGIGLASPSATPYATEAVAVGVPVPRVRRVPALERVRRHPYVRLGLNGSFSALWMGQVISLFGDRVNQIALMAFVYEVTKSPIAVALTPFMGTIPNLVFSPLAGTFVDRWDQKQVLVVSDLLRAALVLLVPVAVLINVWLAYPLVFLITTVTIFFRPARVAVLPRLVHEDELLAANSAMWVGETLADVINYPLAGLFVVFLSNALPIAFWFDAATYLASAALLSTILVPPLVRRLRDAEAEPPTVIADLKEGWAFLRHETVLLANTLQGTVGQFAAGIMTAGAIVLAAEITKGSGDEYRATYAFMEASIGIGNLLGGFAIGLFAGRARKGPMVTIAYIVFGVCLFLVGVGQSVPFVLAMLFGVGVANMAFIIPSQTMFQERTPPELIGRVVSFRFALVLGFSSIAMALAGLLISEVGPGPVIAAAGLLAVGAGVAGLFVRAVREA